MARPPQVNFEVDKELEAQINALVAKSGMKRTDYFRMLAREAIAADAEGRPFLSNKGGIDQTRFAELFYKLDPLVAEIERTFSEVTRLQSKLQKVVAGDERDIGRSTSAAARDIAAQITADLGPLRGQIEGLIGSLRRPDWLSDLHQKLDKSIGLAGEARVQNSYNIQGWNLTGLGWASVAAIMWFASVATFVVFALILPKNMLAVPLANQVLASGSEGICAVVERRIGGTCEAFSDRTGTGVRVPRSQNNAR